MDDSIAQRLERVNEKITTACRKSGRSIDAVRLVAVSKTKTVEEIRAGLSAGIKILGENYIQEAQGKIETLGREIVKWHFIGHLQTNKAKFAVQMFDLIHSVDRLKLARELNKRAKEADRRLGVLVQLNISGEKTKSGADLSAAASLTDAVRDLEHLDLQGFMTMPPFFDEPEKARPFFAALREFRDKSAPDLSELSMGMSGDYEVAIEEGATLVRVGSAIFGPRAYAEDS